MFIFLLIFFLTYCIYSLTHFTHTYSIILPPFILNLTISIDVARRLLMTGISNFPHSKNIGWFHAALASIARQDGNTHIHTHSCTFTHTHTHVDTFTHIDANTHADIHAHLYHLTTQLRSYSHSHTHLSTLPHSTRIASLSLPFNPFHNASYSLLTDGTGDYPTARACYSRAVAATPPQLSLQVIRWWIRYLS